MPNWYFPPSEAELNGHNDELRDAYHNEINSLDEDMLEAFIEGDFIEGVVSD